MAEHPFAQARYPEFPPERGGYESYYLKACSPDAESAVWIRHTVHQRPGETPSGSLWFTFFERGASRPYAVKQTFAELAAQADGGALLAVGDAVFGPREVRGEAVGEGRAAGWDLMLDHDAPPMLHLPERLYKAPLPRTKPLTLYPEVTFRGSLRVADRTIDLSDWFGMVGHNWGAQHAEQWTWLYADGIGQAGDDAGPGGGWLDLVAGRVRLGPVTAPWIANGTLMVGGERIELGGIGRVASTRVRARVGRCTIELRGDGVRARAEFEAPREQLVAWRYADPDGSEHHALNSSLADLVLTIERRHHAPEKLRADGRAVYEWGTRFTAHGLPVEPFADGGPA